MRILILLLLVPIACAQPVGPANWYWNTPLIGGGCNVCAYDDVGNLVASVPYNGTLSSLRMIKHRDGSVWAADTGMFKLVEFLGDGSGVGAELPVFMITNLCTDPAGNIWTSRGALFVPITIEKRDATGAVAPPTSSWTLPLTATNVVDMQSDPSGTIWVHAIDGLYRIDTSGVLTGPLSPAIAGSIIQMAVDHLGEIWTLVDDGTNRWCIRHDQGLTGLSQVQIDDSVAFALDGDGRPRVLRDLSSGQELTCYSRALNPVVSHPVSSSPGSFGSVAVGWDGSSWLSGVGSNGVAIFDCHGRSVGSLAGVASAASIGDRTGLHLMSVLDRLGDADGDGISNARELVLGGDLLDPLEPPRLVSTNPTPTLNEVVTITMPTTDPAGYGYVLAASETTGSFEVTPLCMSVPLNASDPLLLFWLSPLNFLASDVYGTLDNSGAASSTVLIPDFPPLVGASFHFSGVTIDTTSVPSQVAPVMTLTVQ